MCGTGCALELTCIYTRFRTSALPSQCTRALTRSPPVFGLCVYACLVSTTARRPHSGDTQRSSPTMLRRPRTVATVAVMVALCMRPAGGTNTAGRETVCRLDGGEGGALVCTGWADGDTFSSTRRNVSVERGELWLPPPSLPPSAGPISLLGIAGAGIRTLAPFSFEVCCPFLHRASHWK